MKHFLITALVCFCCITPALAAPAYIVREKDGHAAYLDASCGVWHKTDTPVDTLPNPSDRALLRCGIPAHSNAELTRILEDFCS